MSKSIEKLDEIIPLTPARVSTSLVEYRYLREILLAHDLDHAELLRRVELLENVVRHFSEYKPESKKDGCEHEWSVGFNNWGQTYCLKCLMIKPTPSVKPKETLENLGKLWKECRPDINHNILQKNYDRLEEKVGQDQYSRLAEVHNMIVKHTAEDLAAMLETIRWLE